jgi:hypothetical protein
VKTLTLESPKIRGGPGVNLGKTTKMWGKPGENPGETCGKPWKGELGVSSQVKMVDFSAKKRWIDRQKLRFEQLFSRDLQKFGSNKAMP